MKFIHKPNATVGQILKDLERIVAVNPNIFLEYSHDGDDMFAEGIKLRKVVPAFWHDSMLNGYRVNSLWYDYGKLFLCYDEDKESDSITVGELLEEFPVCAEFMVQIKGKYYTLEMDENGRFYSFPKLGDENLFAIHLGDMVFDPNEEWE